MRQFYSLPKYVFAVSEYGQYVDIFPLPLNSVGRLSMDLSPVNVAYQFYMGRRFSAFEIPTLKGLKGEERERSCIRFQNSLEKIFSNG